MSRPIPQQQQHHHQQQYVQHNHPSMSTSPLNSNMMSRARSSSGANSKASLSQSPTGGGSSFLASSPQQQSFIKKAAASSTSSTAGLTAEEYELLNQKKERFQTCKEVLDRLHWDESLADVLSNLSMIYKDRFEGDVLIAYSEYENSELKDDLPEHRIQSFIYRDQHVFWDKNKRIDLIDNKEIFALIDSYLNPQQPQPSSEAKKKKKKSKLPSVRLDKSAASTLVKHVNSGDNLTGEDGEEYEEEDDEIEEYMAEYDEMYGQYLK
ncbi:hypothetical protein C9374_012398 [Naegleria lovaniensis]|uniref:MJ1316 RNA cyclic group end recognition domain-containing protein n=1 Tax=Naegleria lovaniensis TaxID=51637 RepID=A0AA88H0Z6_NAELO|nr:uncharacterized protein C9374_012398 [Naegleria lovaniensis]KAG2392146.1 hypothetical protein C9374_012398 [Naegleria lovaniensis]